VFAGTERWMPKADSASQSSRIASRKWVTEPASITAVRFHGDARQNACCSCSAGMSSTCGDIPSMLTNPPAGIAFRPYSVSPRRKEKIVGPKPTKYRLTRIPRIFATVM
jgi:hypothetical protein